MENPLSLANYQRPTLTAPEDASSVLLHSCCAPCAGEVIEAIRASDIEQTVFFYNPNIHPEEEYRLRKDENKRLCEDLSIPFIDMDYDTDHWFERTRGLEDEPERGKRCTVCFDMRFERTALYAYEQGFSVISSTLGISRWKDMNQINDSGQRSASRYPGITYWTYNWRKKGGSQRMIEISKKSSLYQQEYCGCVYSLRDTNRYRLSQGRQRIKRLVKFYGDDQKKVNEESIIATDA